MLQVHLRAVVGSNHYADVVNTHRRPKGFAIPKGRLWSKWRRDSDGTGGSTPRALKDLLKQVEKAAQVRRSGLDQVLAELKLHRDAAPDPAAQSALAWMCNALSRFVGNPTAAHAREMVIAADAVKRVSG
jgi:hypothetical protein